MASVSWACSSVGQLATKGGKICVVGFMRHMSVKVWLLGYCQALRLCSTCMFSGLRELGRNWTEVASRVASKTAAQCRLFYRAEREKLGLDDLIAEYHASEVTDVCLH